VRTIVFIISLLGFLTSARADDVLSSPGRPVDPPADTPEVVEFIALVAMGDRERRAGRIPEAAMAYARAIKLQRDPVVLGRLGVLLVQLRQYTHAADLLHDALQLAETTPEERAEFFRAHVQAAAWVAVRKDEAGAAAVAPEYPQQIHRIPAHGVQHICPLSLVSSPACVNRSMSGQQPSSEFVAN